jgi:hypothetical protein
MTGAATRQPFEEELNGRFYRAVDVGNAQARVEVMASSRRPRPQQR